MNGDFIPSDDAIRLGRLFPHKFDVFGIHYKFNHSWKSGISLLGGNGYATFWTCSAAVVTLYCDSIFGERFETI
jgi:hypothetical protein